MKGVFEFKPFELFGLLILIAVASWAVGFLMGLPAADDHMLPRCVTEDSSHCYWDASEQGNGVGHDVVNP